MLKQVKETLKKDIIVYLTVFGVLTLPFLLFPELDIILQKPFFKATSGWFLMNVTFWDIIYKYGIFVGYAVSIIALFVLSLSFSRKGIYKWRKAALLMLFVIVLGPGILVNGIFKEHWGRPRPYDIEEFHGEHEFVKLWKKGDTDGKSFPCGHASMGFYLAIPFLFLRKKYRKAAWIFFISGNLYGLLIGIARMLAGGHFAGDVVWSAGMVWFTGILGYYLLKVYTPVNELEFDLSKERKTGRIVNILMGFVLPAMTISLLLATPYISKKEVKIEADKLQSIGMNSLTASFNEGNVNVYFDTYFRSYYAVNAFGFPNSKIRWNWEEGSETHYWLENMGWFTEVNNKIDITFPNNQPWDNILKLSNGDINIDIPNDTIIRNLTIYVTEGNVTLISNNSEYTDINVNSPKIIDNNNILSQSAIVSKTKINIFIENGSCQILP